MNTYTIALIIIAVWRFGPGWPTIKRDVTDLAVAIWQAIKR